MPAQIPNPRGSLRLQWFCWQAQPQLSLSHGFSGCGFILASSAKDWLFCSASELVFTSVCSVQNVKGGGVGDTSGHALGTVATFLAGSECTLSSSPLCRTIHVGFVVPGS